MKKHRYTKVKLIEEGYKALLEQADECYAVANAREELKSTATGVIGSNGECGVPAFIRSRAKAKSQE